VYAVLFGYFECEVDDSGVHAGGDDNASLEFLFAEMANELHAIHVGHIEVYKNQIKIIGSRLNGFECGFARRAGMDIANAQILEYCVHYDSNGLRIVDNQDIYGGFWCVGVHALTA